MYSEILELEKLIKSQNIDISRYGLGLGVIPHWKETTLEVTEKEIQKACESNSFINEEEKLTNIEFKNSEYIKFKQIHNTQSLSVMNSSSVQDLFNLLASKENYLVHSEYGNSCESRAHAMAKIMDKLCIKSGKAFIQSKKIQVADYSWWWLYHVAPIVLVEDGDKKVPYILDPSVFDRAVPLTTWIGKLRARNYYNKYYMTIASRYTLMPWDASKNLQEYQFGDSFEVEWRLVKRKFLRMFRPFIGEIKSL
jgi:hypothetical protein